MPYAGDSEEKYVVKNKAGETLAPGTYFVIRGSDLFAAAGLWAYIHSMETVLEMAAQRPTLTSDEADRIRSIADRATNLAATWQSTGLGRMPD